MTDKLSERLGNFVVPLIKSLSLTAEEVTEAHEIQRDLATLEQRVATFEQGATDDDLSEQIKKVWLEGMKRPAKPVRVPLLQLDTWLLQTRKLQYDKAVLESDMEIAWDMLVDAYMDEMGIEDAKAQMMVTADFENRKAAQDEPHD